MVPRTGGDLRLPSSFRVVPPYSLMKRWLVPVILFEHLYEGLYAGFPENTTALGSSVTKRR